MLTDRPKYSAIWKLVNPFCTNPTKWSNTMKQFVGNLAKNCLSVFDHFVGLALEGLTLFKRNKHIVFGNLAITFKSPFSAATMKLFFLFS